MIKRDWVKQAIMKMKCGKAAGPSGVVAEMLKASGEAGVDLVNDLANSIVYECAIPGDWEISTIVNCFKGKGDSLEHGNYRGIKLLDQVMKVYERLLERLTIESKHR